jgi:hypothetical protein
MTKMKKIITRRDFLRSGSLLTLGSLAGFPMVARAGASGNKKSRVVLVRDENVLDYGGNLRYEVLMEMLDRAVMTLWKTGEPASAWKNVAGPGDIVGVKSNVWFHLPTPKPLERALQYRLMGSGVRRENISIDDRGVRYNPVFNQSTVLVNVRPMRTHHWSGVGSLIKNYIMFTDQPFRYHGNACERLGAIWHFDQVEGKTRLNILVMLTPLFHGIGPHHFSRRYIWPYHGLLVSTDPVAADAMGARIIQAKRNAFFGEDRPISPPPLHIAAADSRFGLGNSRPDRIELVKLGWKKDVLI